MINKKLIFPVAALAILSVAIIGAGNVSADDISKNRGDIAQKIAEKFDLNENEVQEVLDQVREERKSELQARHESRLNEAVENGEITEDQKNLIINKQKEIKENRSESKENYKDMSISERQNLFSEKKEELKAWAEQNDIDPKYLYAGLGHKGHGPSR